MIALQVYFEKNHSEPSEVCKKERMKFIALKTNDGKETGKISFYCRVLEVTRQGFYEYLKNRDKLWKYEALAAEMMEIIYEDECNDTYGRKRMHQALLQRHPDGEGVPSESTVYRVMHDIGITHKPRRKPNGITKADRESMKSDDLLKRDIALFFDTFFNFNLSNYCVSMRFFHLLFVVFEET